MTRYKTGSQKLVGSWILAALAFIAAERGALANPPPPDVMKSINAVIRKHTPKMLGCYTKEQIFKRKHEPVETVDIRFKLESTGEVVDASIRRSEIQEPDAEQCFLKMLRSLPFPTFPTGTEFYMSFPLRFKYAGFLLKDAYLPKKKKPKPRDPAKKKKLAGKKAPKSQKKAKTAKSSGSGKKKKKKTVAQNSRQSPKKKPAPEKPPRKPAATGARP